LISRASTGSDPALLEGFAITTSDRFTIKLTMSDGKTQAEWDSDQGTHAGTLKMRADAHYLCRGWDLNDGYATRQFGGGRFKPELGDVKRLRQVKLTPALFGEIKAFR
jgi:hypothetical protein